MVFDKTIVQFKYDIEIDLEFCVRVRTCEKPVTGKQRLVVKNILLDFRPWRFVQMLTYSIFGRVYMH